MFKEKPVFYIKITCTFITTYFIAYFISEMVFISNPPFAPRINPNFPTIAKKQIITMFQQLKSLTKAKEGTISTSHLIGDYNEDNVTYSQVKEGLHTGQDRLTGKRYIKTAKDYTFNLTHFMEGDKEITLYE